jgi:hypothetical protein
MLDVLRDVADAAVSLPDHAAGVERSLDLELIAKMADDSFDIGKILESLVSDED